MNRKRRWEVLLFLGIILSTYAYNLIHYWMDGGDLTGLLGSPYTLVSIAILCAVMSTVPWLVIVNVVDALRPYLAKVLRRLSGGVEGD